jgi:outer membrane protein OmpA-like peptidoglycan-associated protein
MAIIRRGVDAKRVRATGYGELFPVAGNEPGSRLLNRRVEIIVGNDGHAIQSRLAANAP